MDLYGFYDRLVSALAQDQDLEAWAMLKFGRGLKVYADIRSDAPPGQDDMPYILVERPGAERDQAEPVQRHGMDLTLALSKSALKTRAETGLEEPAGIRLIMEMVTMTVAALRDAMPDHTEMGYSLSSDTIGSLPVVYGYLTLECRTVVTVGQDPLD